MGHLTFAHGGRADKRTPAHWLPLASQIAAYARAFAGRTDIVANVGPGIGGQYGTACWSPLMADLDVNTDTCLPGVTPERAIFNDKIFQLGALPFVGAVTHEAAHARWSCWVPLTFAERTRAGREQWTKALVEVVVSLEESRIEKLAVEKDPSMRAALAQCALSIVLKDFKVNNTLFGASISLALTVGRYALLSPDEIDNFRTLITPYLPLGLMSRLESLIREYHAIPEHIAKDGDPGDAYFERMHDIASRWLVAIRETAAELAEIAEKEAAEAAAKAQEQAEAQAQDAEAVDGAPADGEPQAGGDIDGPDMAGEGAPAGPGEEGETASEDGPGESTPSETEGTPEAGAEGSETEDAEEPAEGSEGSEGSEGAPANDVEADSPVDGELDDSEADNDGEGSDQGEETAGEGAGTDSEPDIEEPQEPARDANQPQPDLRSGIPGEDELGGKSVVVVVEFGAPEEPAEAPEEPEGPDLGEALRQEAGKASMDREGEALQERAEKVAKQKIEDKEADSARHSASEKLMDRRHGTGQVGYTEYAGRSQGVARKPKPAERVASNRLAAILEGITFHDRVVVKRDRVLPGGKLRPRAAVARAADRSRGGRTEIPVWRAKERHHAPETPVKVGIATDVSGSMRGNEEPSAVLTYVLSHAVASIDGQVATATFGNNGYLVNRAFERSEMVQSWKANGGFEAFREAALLLDNELDLLDSDGARILVIFTDSCLCKPEHAAYAKTFMRLCKQKNVAVIWCSYDETPVDNFGHGSIINLTGSPADIANTLGAAIVHEVSLIEAKRSA